MRVRNYSLLSSAIKYLPASIAKRIAKSEQRHYNINYNPDKIRTIANPRMDFVIANFAIVTELLFPAEKMYSIPPKNISIASVFI